MTLGSKIENLKIMKWAGLSVPDFEVFSFDELVPSKERIQAALKSCKGKTTAEKSSVLKKAVTESVERNWNISLDGELFSVRSSSSVEDSSDNSFAGQFDTFLNVERRDICEKIVECVCSLYNENVLIYMEQKGLDLSLLRMNVIVQKMVNSEVSGILFTANPQGILNESVIVAGRGLGENVVSDRIDTTSYYYSLTDNIYYYDGKENLLTDEQVHKLIGISKTICDTVCPYADIEFAVEDGKIYILQARPITTIDDSKPLLFDNSNIVESYPGLSLPLTISFVDMVFAGVFKDAGRRLLKNKRELEKRYDILENTVGNANGRLYYNLNSWYSAIKFLPFSKKIIAIWQELVGVKYKEYDEKKNEINPLLKASVYVNTLTELIMTPRNMKKLNESFTEIKNYVYRRFEDDMSPSEILELFDKIQDRLLSCWGITLLNDTYAFIFTGLLKARLRKKYKNHEELVNSYISGISNIESMKPVKEMIRLAVDKDKISDAEYRRRAKEYIDVYGDRCLEELKLETETFRTDFGLFDRKINEFAKDTEKLLPLLAEQSENSIDLKNDPITKFLSSRCMLGIGNREIQRLNRSRIFGMVREAVLRLGGIYADKGYIAEKRDVFYLTLDEVRALADMPRDMKETVESRKQKYEMYSMLPAYSRIVFSGESFDKNHRSVNMTQVNSGKEEMLGVPCSNGIVEGEACVVTDVKNVSSVKDKILITKMTDPGWVFLLAEAKGVVSEKGSLLSHTAIISRELGIPAVVGIDGLMATVKNGDIVRLDGATGTVKIIKRAS
ncbi:MAG: PEP/pyruvate-binding domain-containing protein [Acutalibacteraceae bacterium]|nr:PEP/pyruvate-binding domain-containing protein [Acutalibacteraceae bacterium]